MPDWHRMRHRRASGLAILQLKPGKGRHLHWKWRFAHSFPSMYRTRSYDGWADLNSRCIHCGQDDFLAGGFGPRTFIECSCCADRGTHVDCEERCNGFRIDPDHLASEASGSNPAALPGAFQAERSRPLDVKGRLLCVPPLATKQDSFAALRPMPPLFLPQARWFCSADCQAVLEGLDRLAHQRQDLGDTFTLEVITVSPS